MSATTTEPKLVIRQRLFRAGLILWTLLLWSTRLINIIEDETLTGSELVTSVAVGVFLLAAAVALFVAITLDRPWQGRALGVLVVAGVARFTTRGIAILASSEFETGFKFVHTVLWVVTVILSVLAAREYSRVRSSAWVS